MTVFWPLHCCFSPLLCFMYNDYDLLLSELWHIFHHELDLDGNGHIDAEELASALYKAGMCYLLHILRLYYVWASSAN